MNTFPSNLAPAPPPAGPQAPTATVAAIQTSTAALGAATVGAVASCPTAKRKFTVEEDAGGNYVFSGRPDFAAAAKKIKVVTGQEDRRHVLGYDDMIRPTFEQAANEYRARHGDSALKTKLMQLNRDYGLQRAPNQARPLEDHLKYSLSQLNSAPGNLNPEAAHENQAIEHVRQQALVAEERLRQAFQHDAPEDPASMKAILLDVFKAQPGGTPITDHANEVRAVVRARLQYATTDKELADILWETQTSTGIDLSKRPGAKTQTSYSLQLAGELQRARSAVDDER